MLKATGPTKAPGLLPNPEERKGLNEAQHVAHSHPSQAHRTISASLEGSGSTLERVTHLRFDRGLPPGPSAAQTHLRLARGQRTCPRAGGQSPPRSRTADLPSSGRPISASLEDSGPALEREANLRLARGQRTCPRAGGQSPPRSRTADLPSSGWPISASLEAVSRHRGQTAPPPNRPPYEGIKS